MAKARIVVLLLSLFLSNRVLPFAILVKDTYGIHFVLQSWDYDPSQPEFATWYLYDPGASVPLSTFQLTNTVSTQSGIQINGLITRSNERYRFFLLGALFVWAPYLAFLPYIEYQRHITSGSKGLR
jgi:hypothetical protein